MLIVSFHAAFRRRAEKPEKKEPVAGPPDMGGMGGMGMGM